MNNIKENTGGTSQAISRTLATIDKIIKSGNEPGHWPGKCPMRHDCREVNRVRRKAGLSVGALALAGMVFMAVVFQVDLAGSLGGDGLKKISKDGDRVEVFLAPVSRDRISHSSGDSSRISQGVFALHGEMADFHSVVKWSLDDAWVFRSRRVALSDSTIVSRGIKALPSNISSELADFVIAHSCYFEEKLLGGWLDPFSTEEIEINGVPVLFKKWEFRTPQGRVGFWHGEPIRQ